MSTTDEIRDAVRERYAAAAVRLGEPSGDGACCGTDCCAGGSAGTDPVTRDNYTADEAGGVEAALAASLGCGNPTALADLSPGEVVLDLGSGGGLDVLLSARRVAPGGTAYGLDMTDEMLALARRHQAEAGIENASFLKGTIEDIPLRDGLVDVVISNCVINLSGDKDAVLREAFRVTRPGGRFAVSDIVLLRDDLPEAARSAMALWAGCISGALTDTEYRAKLAAAGWADADVEITRRYGREEIEEMAAALGPDDLPAGLDVAAVVAALDGAVASAFVRARRPA